jgi:hypothetical protein
MANRGKYANGTDCITRGRKNWREQIADDEAEMSLQEYLDLRNAMDSGPPHPGEHEEN